MKTPDPIQTTEALAAVVAALVGELIILLGLDISDERKSALSTIILMVFAIGAFLHGAWVRGKRNEAQAAKAYAEVHAPAPIAPQA
jgi:high-affinity Fe2+/Pb2+ permease